MAGCPSLHQPARIREETLESGGPLQRKLNFRLRTYISYRVLEHLSGAVHEKQKEKHGRNGTKY